MRKMLITGPSPPRACQATRLRAGRACSEVDRHDPVPPFFGDLEKGPEISNTGIVDENLHGTQLACTRPSAALTVRPDRHVNLAGNRPRTGRDQIGAARRRPLVDIPNRIPTPCAARR